jgi:hypothetical protein
MRIGEGQLRKVETILIVLAAMRARDLLSDVEVPLKSGYKHRTNPGPKTKLSYYCRIVVGLWSPGCRSGFH